MQYLAKGCIRPLIWGVYPVKMFISLGSVLENVRLKKLFLLYSHVLQFEHKIKPSIYTKENMFVHMLVSLEIDIVDLSS